MPYASFKQHVIVGGLDADEHGEKIRTLHETQQRVIVGQIDRGLGRELERIAVPLLPRDQFGQQLLHIPFVADKVVVDDIDQSAITQGVDRVQFTQQLCRRLQTWHATKELDNVAEFAQNGQPRAN